MFTNMSQLAYQAHVSRESHIKAVEALGASHRKPIIVDAKPDAIVSCGVSNVTDRSQPAPGPEQQVGAAARRKKAKKIKARMKKQVSREPLPVCSKKYGFATATC